MLWIQSSIPRFPDLTSRCVRINLYTIIFVRDTAILLRGTGHSSYVGALCIPNLEFIEENGEEVAGVRECLT